MTGFDGFREDEAGYVELRRLFDFLRAQDMVGPAMAGKHNASHGNTNGDMKHTSAQICVIDADDLLDKPAEMIQAFCDSVGIKFLPEMLRWDSQEEEEYAVKTFEKWKGFHEDAIQSRDLRPRGHVSSSSLSALAEPMRL